MVERIDAYVRDRGVVCYSLPVFAQSTHPYRGISEGVRKTILNGGLNWCWYSIGYALPRDVAVSETKPFSRPLATISADSIDAFSCDLDAVDAVDDGRFIGLFGIDRGSEELVVDQYALRLRTALEHFAVYEGGPIRIAVITLENETNSYVYVPHSPIPPVQAILDEWQVGSSNVKTHPYKRLRVISLESLYALR
jgi:hypothetical protein